MSRRKIGTASNLLMVDDVLVFLHGLHLHSLQLDNRSESGSRFLLLQYQISLDFDHHFQSTQV